MRLTLVRRRRYLPMIGSILMVHVLIGACLLYARSIYARGAHAQGIHRSAGKLDPISPEASGELRAHDQQGHVLGACPLQHTEVDADIAGFITRVHVRQSFANPLPNKIEAVYVFPLPEGAAVDSMIMTVGARRVVGKVKPKEQARQIYEQAKAAGHVAGLLDQERPNIFTQSVANIEPGAKVDIEISYVETLKYADGVFEFVFPMVVGPRYIPGGSVGQTGIGTVPDTNRVPDASRISPPVAPPDTRAGHDINVTVHIDGGADLFDVKSELQKIDVRRTAPGHAVVTLKNDDKIPNKDFILRYRTATEEIKDAFFVHPFPGGEYFTMVLQPPRRVPAGQARPKEMIFVIDRSGSQQGFPIEKAKETMRQTIEGMNPHDTFNLISFSEQTTRLFPSPVPNTRANRRTAQRYLDGVDANGGTELLQAVLAALSPPPDPERVRIVCFMTDGFVGNDFEVLDAVKKHIGNARVFSFGIGNSVNRFLLDGMAHAGRGEVEYVTLAKDGDAAAKRFHERIQSPVLTDISLDWKGVKPEEIYPRQLPDLFSDKPILIHGILKGEMTGEVVLKGLTAQGTFQRRIALRPPDVPEPHEALASLWARAKVQDLMMLDMAGLQSGNMRADLKQAITDLGVRYRLMTQFTSFVAVEEAVTTKLGPSEPVAIPVDKADGLSNAMAGSGGPALLAQARAGDPLIRVVAPDDAAQVIALMPDGEIKRLLFDREKAAWLARFDIPTYTPEGDYFVRVVIVLKDGTRKIVLLRYKVDLTPPKGSATSSIDTTAARDLHLELDASEDTARVAALLPWGERIEMTPSTTEASHFAAIVARPTLFLHKAAQVTFILTDRAHNRTLITIDMNP
ncbi:MAG: uncharacterized protein JWL77_5077 [Chthonomonadaceae bacterium]|nr:uncharacterized protein [Chthonomonadaceae bacterium]